MKSGFQKKDIVFISVLICGLILTAVFVNVKYNAFLSSDNAGTLMISKILSDEGGIYSRNWCYSTGVGVLDSTTVIRFVFKFLGDRYKLVRIVSILINTILVVLSYLFMMKKAGHLRAGLMSSVVFCFPYDRVLTGFFIFFMAYVNVFIFNFLILGFLFDLISRVDRPDFELRSCIRNLFRDKKCMILMIVITALNYLSALNGIRQVMYFNIPFCISAFFIMMSEVFHRDHPISKADLFKSKGIFLGLLSVIFMIAAFAGVISNKLVFVNGENYAESSYNWMCFSFSQWQKVIVDLINIFGWSSGVSLFDLFGLKNLLSLVIMAGIIAFSIREIKSYKERQLSEKILMLFILVSIVSYLFLYSMTYAYENRYWLVFVPLLFILPSIYLEKNWDRDGGLSKLYGVILLTVFILCGLWMFRSVVPNENKADMKAFAEWLKDKPYKAGFAKFWQSDILTELTDGRVEMYTVYQDGDMAHVENLSERRPWLQKISHLKEDPQGEVIFILSRDDYDLEDTGQCTLLAMDEHLVYEGNWIKVYGFESMDEYYRAVADQEKKQE